MANMINKGSIFGNTFQPPKPKNKWDITEGSLGLTEGYGDKLNAALDNIFQKQLTDTTNRAQESSMADGSFNPNVSQYYATQGARDAQAKGKVDAMGQARADEYNRFNARNAINNFDLQEGALNLQREQYEDSKPGWLDDVLGIAKSVLPFVPLAEGGDVPEGNYEDVENMQKQLKDIDGKITAVENQLATNKDTDAQKQLKMMLDNLQSHKMAIEMAINHSGKAVKGFAEGGPIEEKDSIPDSDDFHNATAGIIPNNAVNSTTEPNGDNTLIKAQPGEVIQSNPTGDLIGRENLKLINNAGQMVNNMLEQKAIPGTPAFNNNRPQAQSSGFGDIIDKVLGKKNFGGGAGGAGVAKPMAEGGDVPNPYTAQIAEINQKAQALMNQLQSTSDETAKQQIINSLNALKEQGMNLSKQAQDWDTQHGQNGPQQQQVPPTTPSGPPQMSQGGTVQKKITIEEKPTGY